MGRTFFKDNLELSSLEQCTTASGHALPLIMTTVGSQSGRALSYGGYRGLPLMITDMGTPGWQ